MRWGLQNAKNGCEEKGKRVFMKDREKEGKERLCTFVCVCLCQKKREPVRKGKRGIQRGSVCACTLVQRWITSACIFSAAMPSSTSAAASIYIREI